MKVATVAGLDFPHADQAIKIVRWRRASGRPASRETVYAVTDLTAAQATPAQLAVLPKQHRHVEVKVHYVRDVSFGEDATTTRTGHAPTNLATLRSAVVNTLHRAGYRFAPQGRRDHTTPADALRLHSFPRHNGHIPNTPEPWVTGTELWFS